MRERFEFLAGGPLLAFAHRGGAFDSPENTFSAFQHSVDLGYDYVETDVHASRDGVVFAFHDPDLERVTGTEGTIGDLTASEIEQVRVAGSERIPRLEEVLRTWPRLRVNIDPKSDAVVDPLVRLLRRTGAAHRVCIGSFSDRRIRYCRDAFDGDLCTSMGPLEISRMRAASVGLPVSRDFSSPCAQVPTSFWGITVVDHRLIETAQECNVQVHVWTVDDPATIGELIDLGVHGIMTDRPRTLRSVLIDRQLWGQRGDQ